MTGKRTSELFQEVVLPYLDDALSLARWLTGNIADAEDVVQDACVRALCCDRIGEDHEPTGLDSDHRAQHDFHVAGQEPAEKRGRDRRRTPLRTSGYSK